MVDSYVIPTWFFGFDIGIGFLFSLISFAVAFMSLKLFTISEEKSFKNFGLGFLLIALSYIVNTGLKIFIVNQLDKNFHGFSLEHLTYIGLFSTYLYMFLFIAGIITLAYTTFKVKKPGMLYLLITTSFLVPVVSIAKIKTFGILSVFILSYLTYHYFIEWHENKNRKTIAMFLAFLILLLSNLSFAFSPNYYAAYILAHILELGAYLLILLVLIKSVK